jgi:hypothetical protein
MSNCEYPESEDTVMTYATETKPDLNKRKMRGFLGKAEYQKPFADRHIYLCSNEAITSV